MKETITLESEDWDSLTHSLISFRAIDHVHFLREEDEDFKERDGDRIDKYNYLIAKLNEARGIE